MKSTRYVREQLSNVLNDADELTNEEHKIRKEAVKQRVKRCRRTDERRAQDT